MSKKTVVCHFFNEEFLLPWWLQHHKAVFDHGIMIDYASTDRSCDIIREICPSWEIVPSRNQNFVSRPIDDEVEDIERGLEGWRMALNVTEFLYGNTDHLVDLAEPTQYFIGNYVFVDMQDPNCGPLTLDHTKPLHEQRYWGYDDFVNTSDTWPQGSMHRMNRSLHNHAIKYPELGGRHFPGVQHSFDDLVIFHYGWADAGDIGLRRKLQIQGRMEFWERQLPNAHSANRHQLELQLTMDHQPASADLRERIAPILEHNRRITGQEW